MYFMRQEREGKLPPPSTMDINLFDREMNQALLLQTAKEFPASHVLEGTVGLMPVPDSTELSGDERPSLLAVLIDERTNEG
jgi:hypothetical protein